MATVKKKKPLTEEERAECFRLKQIWESKKETLGFRSQEQLASIMGITQGAITQYFNAHTKIGDLILFKFGFHLDFDAEEVRPGFFTEHPELRLEGQQFTREELYLMDVVKQLQVLSSSEREAVQSMIEAFETR